jgi:RNA polymerase sigma-70 factor (ECF subfamily)
MSFIIISKQMNDNKNNYLASEETQQEIELLCRISSHDELALTMLYDKYSKVLFNIILHLVRRQEEAEDILQEVFLQIWNRADMYNKQLGPPISWLIRIARNKAIDTLRSKRHKTSSAEVEMDESLLPHSNHPEHHPDVVFMKSEASSIARQSLSQLPHEQRVLLEKAYFEGYTQSELAKLFSLPLGTVKTRMRNGFLSLQQLLLNSEFHHSLLQ